MLQYSICAFLAPALASAAAFPWALPEPTFARAGDNWSPAPTLAPGLGAMELFKRDVGGLNTCGYISAKSASSLTCNNSNFVCVTNPTNGVHGCCDPSSIAECKILTSCVASSDMSKSCTDSACLTNDYIAKCTQPGTASCYEWRYVFSSRTVMTEHGCATAGFTISVQFTFSDGGQGNSPLPSRVVQSSIASDSESSTVASSVPTSDSVSHTTTSPPATSSTAGGSVVSPGSKSKTNIGAIVGGVVGGLAVLGALAFAIVFFVLRSKKAKQEAAHNTATGVNQPMMGPGPGVAEYKPQAYASPGQQFPPTPGQQYAVPFSPAPTVASAAGYYGQEQKAMFAHPGAPGSPPPPHGGPVPYAPPGAVAPVEAGGTPINAPGQAPPGTHPNQIYEAP